MGTLEGSTTPKMCVNQGLRMLCSNATKLAKRRFILLPNEALLTRYRCSWNTAWMLPSVTRKNALHWTLPSGLSSNTLRKSFQKGTLPRSCTRPQGTVMLHLSKQCYGRGRNPSLHGKKGEIHVHTPRA